MPNSRILIAFLSVSEKAKVSFMHEEEWKKNKKQIERRTFCNNNK